MIKNIKLFAILSLLIISVISCTDESTFRNPVHYELLKTGAFPKLQEAAPATIGAETPADINYSFTVVDINESIATYSLQVAAVISDVQTAWYDVETVTSFPATFTFTSQELADLLEVSVDDFNFGDTFKFRGSCVGKDGITYDMENNTQTNLYTTGYNSAFQFESILACPGEPSVDDLVGTWAITLDDFGVVLDDGIFEIVAGPGENQVTLIDPFGHINISTGDTFNVIMDIKPGSIGSISTQDSWDSGAYDLTYGIGRINGTGNIFTCIGNGSMSFNFDYTVDAGSFGTYSMGFTKL